MEETSLILELFRVGIYGTLLLGVTTATNHMYNMLFKEQKQVTTTTSGEAGSTIQQQTLDEATWLFPAAGRTDS